MVLEVFFIVFTLVCLVSLVMSIRAKRKNWGFVMTSILLMICDVLCIFLFNSQTIKATRNLLFISYISYSWMFMGAVWTVVKMSSIKKIQYIVIPMFGWSVMLTGLLVYCFTAPRMISFTKRVLFGRIWWIAEGTGNHNGLLGFTAYSYGCFAAGLAVVVVACICYFHINKIFRNKYIIISVVQIFLTAMIVLNYIFKLPMWIYVLLMNPVCYFIYYFAFVEHNVRLKSEVIMFFANEMSDGLILYNEYNDLIHVNDLIKNLMDDDILRKMEDINFFENWISHVERVENIEALPYTKGDETLYFTVKRHGIGQEPNAVGTAYVLHDTTNSINQIRLMEQVNSELERTAKMKSDFLANMSHELRTPMNAVIGMAEIALREDLNPRVKDCLTQINHSGRNLLNIINDILDYSKIDAGKMEIILDNYEPLSEVNDIAHVLQTRIGEKDLELFFIVDPTLPHELIGDCMRIRQVLINIANNAIKFTERGCIKITLDCERISADELMLVYHVIDTGQGIKEEDLKKLFESFTQVDSKRNRNVEGTGLGLAISKSLVEAMDGIIGVESEYGKGSDFWFKIPQRVSNSGHDLVVENAGEKMAYCLNERNIMVDEFIGEMKRLGVEAKALTHLEDYEPSGKKDYLFIEEDYYNSVTEQFLDDHPDVIGIVLTDFGSDFKPRRKNARVMMRPITTLASVLSLNCKDISSMNFSSEDDRSAHFIAPDAKVLIVDDNTINLSIAVGLLAPLKIKCEIAQSGMEAIENVKNDKFDLILMDHMMPVMDGIETTEAIREDIPEAADTPIVALTANVMEESKIMFMEAGMVDMIAKPIDVKELYRKLFEILPADKVVQLDANAPVPAEPEEYEHYDCLDCERAIKGLGSAKLFAKVVSEYYKRGPKNAAEIESAKGIEDWDDYAIKTHALKSSSRQIGAMELGEYAETLEHAGKAGDVETITQVHPKAMEIYRRLLDDLSKYFPEEEAATDLPEIPAEELESIFTELAEACDNLDMDGMEACVEKLKKYSYPDGKKDIIDKLYEAIDGMDGDACVEIMDEYRNS